MEVGQVGREVHHFSLSLAGAQLLATSLAAPELLGVSRAVVVVVVVVMVVGMVVGVAKWSGWSSSDAAAIGSSMQIVTVSCRTVFVWQRLRLRARQKADLVKQMHSKRDHHRNIDNTMRLKPPLQNKHWTAVFSIFTFT